MPVQRWVEEWPNVHANRTTNKFFRRYTLVTMAIGGFLFGRYFADESILNNEYYTRPDFKPFPAMVKEPLDYDQEAYNQLLEKNYLKYKNNQYQKSSWYRLLWPHFADFTPRTNRFVGRDPEQQNYNFETGAFPTVNHTYYDHRL